MRIYKIYDPNTKLFSKGGLDPIRGDKSGWSKTGKIWSQSSHVKNHINLAKERLQDIKFRDSRGWYKYKEYHDKIDPVEYYLTECVLIEYDVETLQNEVVKIPLNEVK